MQFYSRNLFLNRKLLFLLGSRLHKPLNDVFFTAKDKIHAEKNRTEIKRPIGIVM